jgi:hypothetical protein
MCLLPPCQFSLGFGGQGLGLPLRMMVAERNASKCLSSFFVKIIIVLFYYSLVLGLGVRV